jgi:hypothetical protein
MSSTALRSVIVMVGLLAVSFGGCHRGGAGQAKYVPAAERARTALAAVLDDWKAGSAATVVPSSVGSIQVADTHRPPGRRLQRYEILGEVPNEGGPRLYSVTLSLDNPAEQKKARYLVVGIDPLWVFHQEDYDMLSHWDHPMHGPETATKGEGSGAKSPNR